MLLWSKSKTKTPERCHAAFIFNFEQFQQINLIFLLLTLKMYLSVQHKIKLTKQLKRTLKNKAVSVKHVHVTRVSQHGDHSDWTLNSRRLGWLKMLRRTGVEGRI